MPFGDFPLKDKIAVVTGAGSGINLSFAQFAVQAGARVIVADLKLTSDGEKFMSGEGAKAARFVKCDVSKRADLENLVTASQKEFGDVPDIYIAGAGVFEPAWSNFWDDTEADGYAQVDININHPIKLARIAIRSLLKANKKGVFLITASLAGFSGTFSAPLYCATKHAVVGFVRSMAELDRLEGIKVCAVAPALVRTPLWTDYPEKMKQFGYTLENTIGPEDVARHMVDLVTNGKYPGGTCLETSIGGARELGTWNIPAPAFVGTKVPDAVIEMNYKPMLEMMKKERGSKI
ncbi:hypothetical protein B0J14DRAFT_578524 [Halenospora varia]|nr:hypothetical protein B0J14DRAFT_578524 [Halenospora varia]